MRQAAAQAQLTGRTGEGLPLMEKVNSIFPALVSFFFNERKQNSFHKNYSISVKFIARSAHEKCNFHS